jgi:hypothetical protein
MKLRRYPLGTFTLLLPIFASAQTLPNTVSYDSGSFKTFLCSLEVPISTPLIALTVVLAIIALVKFVRTAGKLSEKIKSIKRMLILLAISLLLSLFARHFVWITGTILGNGATNYC